MSDLEELLKEQRELELSHVEKLKPTAGAVPSRLVSAMLKGIIHDSRKHAALCQALVDVEAGAAPIKLDIDTATAVQMAQAIKQHIRVEVDMIRRLESMLKQVEDERVADILRYILADERRHHATLTRMSALLDRDETAYDEYLELAQKYMFIPPPRLTPLCRGVCHSSGRNGKLGRRIKQFPFIVFRGPRSKSIG